MSSVLTAQDKEWRAQDDARTLASAKQIMMDEARLTAAQAAARAMVEKAAEEAKAMRSVAGGSDPTRKPPETSEVKRARGHVADSIAKVPFTYIARKK